MSEKPIEQKPIPTKTPDKGHPEGEKKLPVANGAENVGLKEKHYRESRKKLATLQSEADKEAAKKSLKTSQGGQDLGPGKAPPENTKTQQGEPEKAQTELQTAEKETIKAFHEKHEAETKLIAEYKTLEGLDPEAKKAAEKAIQTEYLRKSLSTIPLDHPVIKGLEEEAKKINPDYDKLTGEQKYEICMRTPGAKDKIAGYLADYSKLEPAELNDAKIQELTKKHFGIESLSGEKLGVFKLPQSADALKEQRFVDAANRGLNEKNLEELAKLRGDSLEWNDIPDSMKTAINFDPYFTMDESKLPIKFREEAQEMKAQAREERRPNETAEQYAERIKTTTGANPQQATEMMIQSGGSRYNMSRLGRAIADLFAPIFASLPDPTGAMWRNYMKNNAFFTSGTLAEREAKNGYGGGGGVGGGGEVQGSMPGYSLDVNGEITESEKQTIKTIHEAFKTKVTDVAMQAKLLAMLERHAKNNPNFRADQPFLAHDVGTKKAFVFFPPGEAVVCGATHGYAGVGNVMSGGGTSLGSKTLSKGWSDKTMESRTIVHGLEECNKNDEQRLIRVHESRGPGTKTSGCTGLDPEIAERLQQAVITAGGGAQETFNSNSVTSGAERKEGTESFSILGTPVTITPPLNPKNLSDINKNPLNIKSNKFPTDRKGHSICPSYEAGITIAVEDLQKKLNGQSDAVRQYTRGRDASYVRDVIGTWAPESDGNDPSGYTRTVLSRMGFSGDLLRIPVSAVQNRIPELVLQMAKMEGCEATFKV